MTDMYTYAQLLELSDHLRKPVLQAVIQWLQLPVGSIGLDAGCGIGSNTLLLAEAVAPGGRVIGLDISPEFLDQAREYAKTSILADRVSFQEGDINTLPFDDDHFDWVWSSDCAGYPTGEPVPLIRELSRVVKPGGIMAILAWSSQQLLPGYPELEARLNATLAGIAPFVKGGRPEQHFLRALGWLQAAGLIEAAAKSYIGDVHAPLSDTTRSVLLSFIHMRWETPKSELRKEDWATYQRLTLPESPDFILNRPDYYASFTYTVFRGTVPG